MAHRARGMVVVAFVALAMAPQSTAAAGSVAVGGSLVLAVPSKDGLVLAADSRARFVIPTNSGMRYTSGVCDSYRKIVEPNRPDRTAFAVVGRSMHVAAPSPDLADPCAYLQAPRYYDIEALTRNYLETSGAKVATTETDRLAALCVETIAAFQKTRGDDVRSLWGKLLFGVVLASYEPAERQSIVKAFSIHLRENGEPFATAKQTHAVGPTTRRTLLAFGEFEFLQKQVINGPGKQFLSDGFKAWQKKPRTAEINQSLALDAAVDLIEAASKTVDLLRYESATGGPVNALLLGDQPRPQQLRGNAP